MLFLHISDIHFKAPECLTPDTDPDRGVRTRIERHLATQIPRLGKIDAILIGGDVAFAGDPREYDEARKWFAKLRTITGCENGPMLVVPGNHDVDRTAVGKAMTTRNVHQAVAGEKDDWREATLRAQLADPQTGAALFHGHAAYNDFAAPMQCQIYPEKIYWKQDLDLTPQVKLRIHGLTSTLLSGRDGKDDPRPSLYVSPLQTALDPVPNVVNMVMCHHPFDWLIDGDDVENALDRRATFQLFGHKHKQRVQREAEFVRWGAGAVNPSRSEKQYEPGYNLVHIVLTGTGNERHLAIETHQFTYQSNPEGFRPILTSAGEDVFRHIIPFPEDAVASTGVATPNIQPGPPVDANADAEAAMGAEINRNIVSRFWELDSSDRRKIALELGLISRAEVSLPEPERYGKALIRAKERDLLDRLAEMISDREGK
ncbi:metallophosphoesterase [Bradyrhizobium sp. 155]|uniref:metallophosphoesterase n=1 Tax=Bradyrhizobium sp. 155 TaxID=2782629 RepID=UPI001FFF3454|nr:metallophosphoesterase [Bradyrhizobium sp. 155]